MKVGNFYAILRLCHSLVAGIHRLNQIPTLLRARLNKKMTVAMIALRITSRRKKLLNLL
jgi:hypothetical protein